MTRLNGKVAIITGAASGMGLAALQLFAAEGARVAATDISAAALRQAVDDVTANGGEAIARTHDVSSPEAWRRVVDDVVAEWGTIDILINNAGILLTKGVLEAELDDWNLVMGINLTGTWLGMKSVIPTMQAAGHGSIVNIASIGGIVGGLRRWWRRGILRVQGRGPISDETHRPVVRQGQYPRQLGPSRPDRYRVDPCHRVDEGNHGQPGRCSAAAPCRRSIRHRLWHALSGLGRGEVRHRFGACD